MTDTLAPVECTNWALSAWNSTLDRNDVPSAWLYGQDHLWATGHLVSSPGEVFPPPSHPPPHNTGLKLMHKQIVTHKSTHQTSLHYSINVNSSV